MKNRITNVTRQHIADEVLIAKLWYHGNQTEPDFLARLQSPQCLPQSRRRCGNHERKPKMFFFI